MEDGKGETSIFIIQFCDTFEHNSSIHLIQIVNRGGKSLSFDSN